MASANIINKRLHSTTQNGPTIKPPPYLVRVAPRRQYYATTVTALPAVDQETSLSDAWVR